LLFAWEFTAVSFHLWIYSLQFLVHLRSVEGVEFLVPQIIISLKLNWSNLKFLVASSPVISDNIRISSRSVRRIIHCWVKFEQLLWCLKGFDFVIEGLVYCFYFLGRLGDESTIIKYDVGVPSVAISLIWCIFHMLCPINCLHTFSNHFLFNIYLLYFYFILFLFCLYIFIL
jgi:hypothetical protein